eukprot:CAMPEP_0118893788 /NCGR_PEP_ID=MMETSP1166-20130328/2860_1 /TAXON_ID=1104430 /ORGANISM="Chrysoreinhardia sp, Strain CCMP3193" /LENGTH=103 /DNA_ID=CAMNT_0006832647 /DNA_START=42 /DNA_END=353 /DNA_ORIENTATION=+
MAGDSLQPAVVVATAQPVATVVSVEPTLTIATPAVAVATAQPQTAIPTRVHAFVTVDHRAVIEERYCGPVSCCIACVLILVFWPAALFVPCCPCDQRRRVIYT